MRTLFFATLLMFSTLAVGQEIGSIQNGKHTIKLYKSNGIFSFKYSDTESLNSIKEHSFSFTDKNDFYSIIINGFKNANSHQIILQTSNHIIVKLNYRKVKNELMLYVYQNNLKSKISGRSTFFTKKQIIDLFKIQQEV